MRILVIGGTGFLGAKLCRGLRGAGAEVVAADLPGSENVRNVTADGIAFRGLDIRDRDAVRTLFATVKPDRVVNLAYVTGQSLQDDRALAGAVNLMGQIHCMDAAVEQGVGRYIYSSSIATYGPDQQYYGNRDIEETDGCPLDRHSLIYGAMKAYNEFAAERYRLEHGLEVCGIRLSVIFGPGRLHGYTAWTSAMISHPMRGETIHVPLAEDQRINLISVDDAARLLSLVTGAERISHTIVNSGGHGLAAGEVAETVRSLEPSARFAFAAAPTPPLFVDRVSGKRAEAEFGFRPTPFHDDLATQFHAAESA
ncbi:NAD(P)-dependent oxidoreductase [Marivibrio halodurans]|uniref:NAD(P)-dependent oxidoreductase n=1 Tax=Marivibrio halodurans TaxID=2039722 RepID=A0A8J7V3L5_9PROT|nr:NAD(P)-dependent oxidoreductase [Marivibrio halodurans]MBP5858386.1 NAD(P)-dependent oxidoreductase [Marivibrio halodurans]